MIVFIQMTDGEYRRVRRCNLQKASYGEQLKKAERLVKNSFPVELLCAVTKKDGFYYFACFPLSLRYWTDCAVDFGCGPYFYKVNLQTDSIESLITIYDFEEIETEEDWYVYLNSYIVSIYIGLVRHIAAL